MSPARTAFASAMADMRRAEHLFGLPMTEERLARLRRLSDQANADLTRARLALEAAAPEPHPVPSSLLPDTPGTRLARLDAQREPDASGRWRPRRRASALVNLMGALRS